MKCCRGIVSIVISNLILLNIYAEEKFNIKDLALPSETQNLEKKPGALFYSPTTKGKALIPVNVWGEVATSGVHYIPMDTDLVKGLSLAGGPRSTGRLDNIKVTRRVDNKIDNLVFNLEKGGDVSAFEFKLEPGDTVFVEKSTYTENRAYYTSLIGVVATILSSILLYREVKR